MPLRPSRTGLRAALLAAAVALAATGCGSGGGEATATDQPSPAAAAAAPTLPVPTSAAPAPSSCPSPTTDGEPWPADVPADLPKPAAITVATSTVQDSGLHVVRFSNPVGLRDNVVFIVNALPAAGYVLGRGDAEALEADAPFQKDNVRGILRMVSSSDCATEWLLAFAEADQSGSQASVPSYTPSGSPSPLPFG